MKVLFWHERDDPAGGAESMLRDLTTALKRLGHSVAWLHSEHIQEAVNRFQPDIVQVWTINNRMPITTACYLQDNKIPHVWAQMNYWAFCSENIMLRNGDESCDGVTGTCNGICQSHRVNMLDVVNNSPVLALNEYSADIFKRNGLRCDYVAELGIDTELFKPDYSKRGPGVQIFTSSAWVNFPHKGMKYLHQAVNGSDYTVNVMTGLTREQVAEGLKHADIFVFPSTYEETWGLCLTEAMASGCACIATDIAGARAQIHDGTGILVPTRDPLAIREAIDKLVSDKELRERIGKNAREHVAKYHTLEAMGKRFESVYKDLI